MLILEENVKQHLKCIIHFSLYVYATIYKIVSALFSSSTALFVFSLKTWDSLRTLNSFKFIKTGVILCFCMFV